MKALVTGATGFIGGNLVRKLLEQGFQVRALVRKGSNPSNINGLDLEVAVGDLRDEPSLEKALDGCEALFHVAALYSFWVPKRAVMYETNVEGTRNILTAAVKKGIRRIVYTSSESTVGIPKGGGLGREDMALDPRHLAAADYKRSKYLAEQVALEGCRAGIPLVVVNPTAPIGPWDVKPTPTGGIVLGFLKGRMKAYINTGLNVVDVEDVAVGHILALEKGRVGERYILGNQNLSLSSVFHILEGITGIRAPRIRLPIWLVLVAGYADEFVATRVQRKPPRLPVAAIKVARQPRYVDVSKAVRELGMPQSPVEDAFKKAVSWFREKGYVG